MQLLPTHCRNCGTVALAPRYESEAAAPCQLCQGEALVVPGPRFGAHEQQLFGELTIIARGAQLRPAEAQRVCIDIEMGLASADQPGTFQRLSERFPALAALSPRLGGSPARQARALRMLETIFNALSIPGKSVTMSSAPVPQRRNA